MELEDYVKRTRTVLVYCSEGYFHSRNCMRELVAAHSEAKPIIALVELDLSRGGMSFPLILTQLLEADGHAQGWGFCETSSSPLAAASQSSLASFLSASESLELEYVWPGGQRLHDALLSEPTIEWNRIGHFQDVVRECLLMDSDGL